jgi:D-alanyl-D-alanine carboxypeptidase
MLGKNGQRYVVVFMVNNPKASLTKPAQDALLEWVYSR